MTTGIIDKVFAKHLKNRILVEPNTLKQELKAEIENKIDSIHDKINSEIDVRLNDHMSQYSTEISCWNAQIRILNQLLGNGEKKE
jgi:hypothetical protein